MSTLDPAVIIALLGAVVAFLTGVAAFLRSSVDRDNVIVGSAKDVVEMLGKQVDRMETRLTTVEGTVLAWESWAERVLTLLDRAIGLIDETHRVDVAVEADRVRRERPDRPRPLPGTKPALGPSLD